MERQYRQGDLLIVEVPSIPAKAKKLDHGILQEGEATGHVHAVDVESAVLLRTKDGLFVNVLRETSVTHQEHDPVQLPVGIYKVIRQREYQPKRAARWVHD